MVTIYNIKKNSFKEGKPYLLLELRGLSTDNKPTKINNSIIDNGSVFIEIDTHDVYMYDLENETWINPDVNTNENNEEVEENQEENVGE